jgi:hypothetical protein
MRHTRQPASDNLRRDAVAAFYCARGATGHATVAAAILTNLRRLMAVLPILRGTMAHLIDFR